MKAAERASEASSQPKDPVLEFLDTMENMAKYIRQKSDLPVAKEALHWEEEVAVRKVARLQELERAA